MFVVEVVQIMARLAVPFDMCFWDSSFDLYTLGKTHMSREIELAAGELLDPLAHDIVCHDDESHGGVDQRRQYDVVDVTEPTDCELVERC